MAAAYSDDLARTTLRLLTLGALIATSFWIMRPFLMALAWATMIAVATWPLLLRVEGFFGGRRGPAVALMTVALLLLLIVPLSLGIETVVENTKVLVHWSKSLPTLTVPPPPAWLDTVPLVGANVAARWQELAAAPDTLADSVAPFVRNVVLWFAGQVGSVGVLFLQFLLTVAVTAIFYARGETFGRGIDRFARRLAGTRGERMVHLAGQAIRAVALGVVVTAIVQSALGGIGLVIAGVPFAAILTALMFMLAIAQIGAAPVLLGAVIWVYATRSFAFATGFLVWAIFCSVLDNVVRPLLIRRGADLPLLLIFVGVIGGLIAFGVIGLFIGPVVLAVGYTLLVEWVADDAPPEAAPDQPTG